MGVVVVESSFTCTITKLSRRCHKCVTHLVVVVVGLLHVSSTYNSVVESLHSFHSQLTSDVLCLHIGVVGLDPFAVVTAEVSFFLGDSFCRPSSSLASRRRSRPPRDLRLSSVSFSWVELDALRCADQSTTYRYLFKAATG